MRRLVGYKCKAAVFVNAVWEATQMTKVLVFESELALLLKLRSSECSVAHVELHSGQDSMRRADNTARPFRLKN